MCLSTIFGSLVAALVISTLLGGLTYIDISQQCACQHLVDGAAVSHATRPPWKQSVLYARFVMS